MGNVDPMILFYNDGKRILTEEDDRNLIEVGT